MTFIPGFRGANITGNTANAGTAITSGTMVLAGGNNITLSQAGNTVTISGANGGGAAGSNTLGMSNLGNTSGTTGVVSGSNLQFAFAGGNNVTLSQSLNASSGTITISAASQSIQTQGLQSVVANTNANFTGTSANISSGVMTLAGGNNITLSQAGNAITISGGNGGGGGIAAVPDAVASTFSSGTVNFADAGGALTISAASAGGGGQTINFSVPATSSLVGVNGITLSTTGSTISISGPGTAGNAQTLDFYQNMDRGNTAVLGIPFNSTGGGTLMLQRLNQENDKFAGNITANTVLMNISGSGSSNSSSSHSMSVYLGIYSDNTTALSLINSASTSWAMGAASNLSVSYLGPRWLSFVSSQWSTTPALSQGGEYVLGALVRGSNLAVPLSYIGQNYMISAQRSGTLGTSVATNTSLAQGNYWNAIQTVSTAALPSVISSNQVNRNNASAIFMPHVILNNRYSGTF